MLLYTEFLPICREDMEKRGGDEMDFVVEDGDACMNHLSFGTAIISRQMQAEDSGADLIRFGMGGHQTAGIARCLRAAHAAAGGARFAPRTAPKNGARTKKQVEAWKQEEAWKQSGTGRKK